MHKSQAEAIAVLSERLRSSREAMLPKVSRTAMQYLLKQKGVKVSTKTILRWEYSDHPSHPSPQKLEAWAAIVGRNPRWFYGEEDVEPTTTAPPAPPGPPAPPPTPQQPVSPSSTALPPAEISEPAPEPQEPPPPPVTEEVLRALVAEAKRATAMPAVLLEALVAQREAFAVQQEAFAAQARELDALREEVSDLRRAVNDVIVHPERKWYVGWKEIETRAKLSRPTLRKYEDEGLIAFIKREGRAACTEADIRQLERQIAQHSPRRYP